VVLVVDTADAAQRLGRGLVIEMAHQRIARIGGDRRNAAGVQDLRRLLQQPVLRILGVDFKILRHGPDCRRRGDRLQRTDIASAHGAFDGCDEVSR